MTKPSGELSSWQERFNKFLAFPEDNILDGFATEKIKSFIATEINRAKREAEIALIKRLEKRKMVLKQLIKSHDLDIDRERLDEVNQLINQIINQSENK